MKNVVEDVVTKCDDCQQQKAAQHGYGHTAAREALMPPWQEVAVDLIGPWYLSIGGHTMSFTALTVIDTVTNLVKLVCLGNKTAANVAQLFENAWLAHYPKPMRCIHDQGGEFTGYSFQSMLN